MRLVLSWLREFVDLDASAEDVASRIGLRGFEVAAVEPVSADNAVIDLPAPDSPIMPRICPASALSEMPLRIGVPSTLSLRSVSARRLIRASASAADRKCRAARHPSG